MKPRRNRRSDSWSTALHCDASTSRSTGYFTWVNPHVNRRIIALSHCALRRLLLRRPSLVESMKSGRWQGTQLREGKRSDSHQVLRDLSAPNTNVGTKLPFPARRRSWTTCARWLNPPEWTKTEVLEFPGSVDGPWARYVVAPDARGIGTVRWPRMVPKDADCAASLKQRTLTNLYNQRPAWLDLGPPKARRRRLRRLRLGPGHQRRRVARITLAFESRTCKVTSCNGWRIARFFGTGIDIATAGRENSEW